MTSGFSRSRSQYQSSMRMSPWVVSSVGRRGASGGVDMTPAWQIHGRSRLAPVAVEVRRTESGADVLVDGTVRATFAGDPDDPGDAAALDELVAELFGGKLDPPVK